MEQGLINLAYKYQNQVCPIHPEEELDTLCIDTNCQYFFQPSCFLCAQNNHQHYLKTMIKLKSCLLNIANNSKDSQFVELETVDKSILEKLKLQAKEYRRIGEDCIMIAENMYEQAENLAVVQSPQYYKCQASNFVGVILANQENIQALKKGLHQLRNVLEFNGDQIKFKKPVDTLQKKSVKLKLYTHRIQQNQHKVRELLQNSEKTSFNDLTFTLEKTQFNDSQRVHEILPGIEFHGDPQSERTQVLASSESFYKGKHGMIIKILERCRNYDVFFNVGFMVESKIDNTYPKDGPWGAGICVYTGTRPIQMRQVTPGEFDTRTGDEIKVELDFQNSLFAVENLRQKLRFEFFNKEGGFVMQKQMPQDQRIKFRVSFNGPNSTKIQLVKSY